MNRTCLGEARYALDLSLSPHPRLLRFAIRRPSFPSSFFPVVMDEPCPKYRIEEKFFLLREKSPVSSAVSLPIPFASCNDSPIDPPPYTLNPVLLQRSGSAYKRSSQLVCPSRKKKAKLQGPCPFCLARYLREILRAWVETQRKPFTAITVQIDRLTSESYEENDIGGIVDLIEVIRIQDSGPTEAARAIRKKLYVPLPQLLGTS